MIPVVCSALAMISVCNPRQFDFYYYAVRKGRRFGFPKKVETDANLELVMEHYKYSKEKAEAALRLLTEEQLQAILKTHDTGGR